MTTNAIQFQGIQLQRGNGAGPEVFTTIGEVMSFSGPGGNATVIDASHAQSTAKEKLMGLKDEGQLSFEANLVPGDAAQTGLRTDRNNRTLRNFKLILTDAGPTTLTFAAYVLGFAIAGSADDKITLSVTLEISGAVTWA